MRTINNTFILLNEDEVRSVLSGELRLRCCSSCHEDVAYGFPLGELTHSSLAIGVECCCAWQEYLEQRDIDKYLELALEGVRGGEGNA